MSEWQEWTDMSEIGCFAHLNILVIEYCAKLKNLPSLPLSLRELKISNVGLIALPGPWQGCNQNLESTSLQSALSSEWSSSSYTNYSADIPALENLDIWSCEELMYLPPGGLNKFVVLNELKIRRCPKLTMCPIHGLPSSLRKLKLRSSGEFSSSLPELLQNLISLTELDLEGCVSMTSLPSQQVFAGFTSLHRISIENCQNLAMLDSLQVLTSLKLLKIYACDKLVEVASNVMDIGHTENYTLSLEELDIDNSSLLLMEPLRSLTSTQRLIIREDRDCAYLSEQWLLQNCTSLISLHLYNVHSLLTLPACLEGLSNLSDLTIMGADQLQSLPSLPSRLTRLYITCCSEALELRYKGPDWPRIAHIPSLFVSQHVAIPFAL